jgi:hypothetical protein
MDGQFDQRRYLIPFRSSLLPQIFTDTLVIGGGRGGAAAARRRGAARRGDRGRQVGPEVNIEHGVGAGRHRGGDARRRHVDAHVRDTLEAPARATVR